MNTRAGNDTYYAYHNKQFVKDMIVNRIAHHMAANELVKGIGWNSNGRTKKGCAIVCTLDRYDNAAYESEIGLPIWLAYLEERLFENVSDNYSKDFPLRLKKAIPVGLSKIKFDKIKAKSLVFILKINIERVEKLDLSDKLKKKVIDGVNQCLSVQEQAARSGEIDQRVAARSAASAESAAKSAERSAERSAVVSAKWSAERSAKWSAESAVASVEWNVEASAVASVEASVRSSASVARSSVSVVRSSASVISSEYEKYADHLIQLLTNA